MEFIWMHRPQAFFWVSHCERLKTRHTDTASFFPLGRWSLEKESTLASWASLRQGLGESKSPRVPLWVYTNPLGASRHVRIPRDNLRWIRGGGKDFTNCSGAYFCNEKSFGIFRDVKRRNRHWSKSGRKERKQWGTRTLGNKFWWVEKVGSDPGIAAYERVERTCKGKHFVKK